MLVKVATGIFMSPSLLLLAYLSTMKLIMKLIKVPKNQKSILYDGSPAREIGQ